MKAAIAISLALALTSCTSTREGFQQGFIYGVVGIFDDLGAFDEPDPEDDE